MPQSNQELQQFEGRIQDLWVGSNRIPHRLYHYTTATSALMIINTNTLWLTHANNLNDSNEVHEGTTVVLDALRAMSGAQTHNSTQNRFFAGLFNEFKSKGPHAAGDVYVCSFTEARNDLSQWRAYGGNGTGYALGYELAPAPAVPPPGGGMPNRRITARLVKCSYDSKELHAEVSRQFQAVADEYARFLETQSDDAIRHAAEQIAGTFCMNLAAEKVVSFKNDAYVTENEWRLHCFVAGPGSNDVEFRSSSRGIVPYLPMDMLSEKGVELREVVIGPSSDVAGQEKAMRMLLAKSKRSAVVTTSAIPYRS